MINIDKNSVSLAGEFAVLSQLALRGFDANLTLGHTKGVDILVSDPKKDRMLKIEVKTGLNNPATEKLFGDGEFYYWIMNSKHESIKDPLLYYCFVNISSDANFKFFIVPSKVVASYVKNEHAYWHSKRKKTNATTTMRKFRIGIRGNFLIPTPLVKNYENKWDFE